MSMDLFRKIVDEAETIPQVEMITITGLGEPLLDKHLMERLKYIRKVMPAIKLDVFTNGSHLTVDKAKELRDAGLTNLYVSINAVDKRKRSAIMKLDDYDELEPRLHQIIEECDPQMRVVVKAVCSKDLMEVGEAEIFMDKWNGPFDKISEKTGRLGNGFLHLEGNWAGEMWPMRVAPTTICSRVLAQIMVLWDGRVSLCCFDGEGEVIFGDLNTQGIREIYNGPKALEYRQAHFDGRRGEMKLCATCTAI
jgi:hypothetical protein